MFQVKKMKKIIFGILTLLALSLLLSGCGEVNSTSATDNAPIEAYTSMKCIPGEVKCMLPNSYQICGEDGRWGYEIPGTNPECV